MIEKMKNGKDERPESETKRRTNGYKKTKGRRVG